MNVAPAWQKGYTGKGVVVSILDDGIQTNHPDLAQNYVSRCTIMGNKFTLFVIEVVSTGPISCLKRRVESNRDKHNSYAGIQLLRGSTKLQLLSQRTRGSILTSTVPTNLYRYLCFKISTEIPCEVCCKILISSEVLPTDSSLSCYSIKQKLRTRT